MLQLICEYEPQLNTLYNAVSGLEHDGCHFINVKEYAAAALASHGVLPVGVSYVRTSPHTQACILSFAGKQRPSHTGARASHICAGTRLSVSGSSGFSRGKWDGSATECAPLIA